MIERQTIVLLIVMVKGKDRGRQQVSTDSNGYRLREFLLLILEGKVFPPRGVFALNKGKETNNSFIWIIIAVKDYNYLFDTKRDSN